MKEHSRPRPRLIRIAGAEHVGKTALGMMMAGRLRTRSITTAITDEPDYKIQSSAERTFELAHLLANTTAHVVIDAAPALCAHAYEAYLTRDHEGAPLQHPMPDHEAGWLTYVLPASCTRNRLPEFRRGTIAREAVDHHLHALSATLPSTYVAKGVSLQERFEWVYHHVIWQITGQRKDLRVYEQIHAWFAHHGVAVLEVRAVGSRSLIRFHPPSDHDDFDALVVVDGDERDAERARAIWKEHGAGSELTFQADLDLGIVPVSLIPHEV